MDSSHPAPLPLGRVSVITVGDFGKAVARYLAKFCRNLQEIEWAGIESFDRNAPSPPNVQILAAWRPVPELCRFLDELSHRHSHPFLPVITESSTISIGPIIVPGKSGCWRCWHLRFQQHTKFRAEHQALLQFYAANPHAGPAGYLEPLALLSAAQVACAIQSPAHLQQVAGHVWRIDPMTRAVSQGYLIGVNDCPQCGLRKPLQDRTWAQIREKLAFLSTDLASSDSDAAQTADGTHK